LEPKGETDFAENEIGDSRKVTRFRMRLKEKVRTKEAPVIVIEKGEIRGVFATREMAVEFTKSCGRPHAILFLDDGRWDLSRFRGESPWTMEVS